METEARLAVFISGNGTGLQSLIDAYHAGVLSAPVALVVSNNSQAYGLQRAKLHSIETFVWQPTDFISAAEADMELLEKLRESRITHVVLSGYLKLLPASIVAAFKNCIVNIHPALLPKYGGKGMFGLKVHAAVLASGDRQTGATVHLVDDEYDHGRILETRTVPVLKDDTPESLAERVRLVEHKLYPAVVEKLITRQYDLNHGSSDPAHHEH